jgi:hypothetical protein
VHYVGFEVLTAVVMKSTIFWVEKISWKNQRQSRWYLHGLHDVISQKMVLFIMCIVFLHCYWLCVYQSMAFKSPLQASTKSKCNWTHLKGNGFLGTMNVNKMRTILYGRNLTYRLLTSDLWNLTLNMCNFTVKEVKLMFPCIRKWVWESTSHKIIVRNAVTILYNKK